MPRICWFRERVMKTREIPLQPSKNAVATVVGDALRTAGRTRATNTSFLHTDVVKAYLVLKLACKRITLHLSHVTIDGPGASPSHVPRGTFGILEIALSSTASGASPSRAPTTPLRVCPFADMTMSFAAWYNDCAVTVAPITTPGHRAYLAYSLVSSDGEPHRTSPATMPAAAAELTAQRGP